MPRPTHALQKTVGEKNNFRLLAEGDANFESGDKQQVPRLHKTFRAAEDLVSLGMTVQLTGTAQRVLEAKPNWYFALAIPRSVPVSRCRVICRRWQAED